MPEVTGPRFDRLSTRVLVRDNRPKLGHATDYLKNPISVFLECRVPSAFRRNRMLNLIELKTKTRFNVFPLSYLIDLDFFLKIKKES